MRRLVLLASLMLAACEENPEAGDACKPSEIRCLDPTTELACQDGVFIEAPCKGPKGCREGQATLLCDITGNQASDVCATDEDGNAACIEDGKKRIVCRSGGYVVEPCRGARGCHKKEGEVRCDQSRAAVGDPCVGATHACGLDSKSVLACEQGRFVAQADCPGEEGCKLEDGRLSCDQSSGKQTR